MLIDPAHQALLKIALLHLIIFDDCAPIDVTNYDVH